MHMLFLGIQEFNYEMIQNWLKVTPQAGGVSSAGFLKLRPFMLWWLKAYPLTCKKGDLGTGSFVAEDWITITWLSQFLFGYCTKEYEKSSKYGVDDMSCMVISYHAFVARCLTHSGIDVDFIRETELYLKEFLSSVREFDVPVRHAKLTKPKKI